MLSAKEKLDTLTFLGIELNQVQDLDILMERILSEARRFVNADAGSIYTREEDLLHFTYTQNDTQQKRLAENEKLIYSLFTLPINEKSMAGYVAATGRPLNIPDAYEIEPTAPYGFSKRQDEASKYTTRSILTIPLKTPEEQVLGVLQVINAQDPAGKVVPFSSDDERMMLHFASIAAVALQRAQMIRSILLRMIQMAEMRDPTETGDHVNRVGAYAVEIYEQWAHRRDLPSKEVNKNRDILRMAAMLHDVGKVAISDVILKKPGRLTDDEYEDMKQHTLFGAQLFLDRQSELDRAAGEVALTHHEYWDGNGYPGHVDVATGAPLDEFMDEDGTPRGRKGEEIPLFGRIVALGDVYDALSSARAYKESWDESRVLSTIEEESGTHFDPEIVEIFLDHLDIMRSIQERYVDSP